MKKIFLSLIFISAFNYSFCQLTVLDEIIGKLIPGVVNGINSVISNNKKGKVDTSQVKTIKTNVQSQMNDVISALAKDEANIDVLNKIFLKTYDLSPSIAAMRVLITTEILNEANKYPNLDLQIIKAFKSNFATFSDKISDLSNIPDVGNNPTLQSQLNTFANTVSKNLKSLSSDIGFGGPLDNNSDSKNVIAFINNLNSSSIRSEIDHIIDQVEQFNGTLSGYISAFSTSIKDAKSNVESQAKDSKVQK